MKDTPRFWFETATIVGVGLIGGSLGKALLSRQLVGRVIGVGRDGADLSQAIETGAVTDTQADLAHAARDADLIVVCTPVGQIVETVLAAARTCRPGTCITDVGSSKTNIVDAVEASISSRIHYLGSHPFAGNHASGVSAARGDLFQDQVVVVTPTPRTHASALQTIRRMWESVGSQVREMTPTEHDTMAAQASHLPHLVAATLAAVTPATALPFVAGGWRDGTRVAASDIDLWADILLTNRGPVLAALNSFSQNCDRWRLALEQQDAGAIRLLLLEGKERRDAVGH